MGHPRFVTYFILLESFLATLSCCAMLLACMS
jgi:hypothetical protein